MPHEGMMRPCFPPLVVTTASRGCLVRRRPAVLPGKYCPRGRKEKYGLYSDLAVQDVCSRPWAQCRSTPRVLLPSWPRDLGHGRRGAPEVSLDSAPGGTECRESVEEQKRAGHTPEGTRRPRSRVGAGRPEGTSAPAAHAAATTPTAQTPVGGQEGRRGPRRARPGGRAQPRPRGQGADPGRGGTAGPSRGRHARPVEALWPEPWA